MGLITFNILQLVSWIYWRKYHVYQIIKDDVIQSPTGEWFYLSATKIEVAVWTSSPIAKVQPFRGHTESLWTLVCIKIRYRQHVNNGSIVIRIVPPQGLKYNITVKEEIYILTINTHSHNGGNLCGECSLKERFNLWNIIRIWPVVS